MKPSKSVPGVSVGKLLLGAAAAGVMGGVVLSYARAPKDDDALMNEAEVKAAEVIPHGEAVQPPKDFMAPDPVSLRGIPPYPGAEPRKLTSQKAGAEISASSWFQTPDSVDKVLSFYEEAYTRANIMYSAYRFSPRRGYVSWFEYRRAPDGGLPEFGEGVMHMVIASQEGENTVVLLSANEPYKVLQRASALPAGVRLPPSSQPPRVMSMGELGASSFSIFAAYEAKSVEQLLAELLREMKEGGWAVKDPVRSPEGRVTVVASLNSNTQVAVVESTDQGSQVLVTVEEERSTGRQ